MSAWASFMPWLVTLAAALLLVCLGALWLAAGADRGRRARAREALAALAQYGLLFGFAAVAAAISAHGLIGFARASMGLTGAWPVLLWGSLDGAAGLCAVLLMRRAARGESALAPRLAVWGLVAASATFNWTHAPGRPGAREAFALMPLIAATLFEFSLRETRHAAARPGRQLTGQRWLHPAERIRVQMQLVANETLTAQDATRQVRVDRAARSLHRRAAPGHHWRGHAPGRPPRAACDRPGDASRRGLPDRPGRRTARRRTLRRHRRGRERGSEQPRNPTEAARGPGLARRRRPQAAAAGRSEPGPAGGVRLPPHVARRGSMPARAIPAEVIRHLYESARTRSRPVRTMHASTLHDLDQTTDSEARTCKDLRQATARERRSQARTGSRAP
jgi:hypothetical protein